MLRRSGRLCHSIYLWTLAERTNERTKVGKIEKIEKLWSCVGVRIRTVVCVLLLLRVVLRVMLRVMLPFVVLKSKVQIIFLFL